jgi:hypothetical protein
MSTSAPGLTSGAAAPLRSAWMMSAAVFCFVALLQLWLVSRAGTDIPFYDQWDLEGRGLFPAWNEGTLTGKDLLKPVNEHRIVWTNLLNLSLFVANGQWDPLVELVALAAIRAAGAAGVVLLLGQQLTPRALAWAGVAVAWAFLPHLAWHVVLWGVESQVSFCLGFSVLTLGLLGAPHRSSWQTAAGLAAGGAAVLAMGPGALVPLPLLGLAGLQVRAAGRINREAWSLTWPAAVLLIVALGVRTTVPGHADLQAANGPQFFTALGRLLAWPHAGQPLAAIPMNVPLVILLWNRGVRRRAAATGENFILLAGGWSAAIALATAWMRGGSPELVAGVPSRYVDFIVLLPLANLGAVVLLATLVAERWRKNARLLSAAWVVFLFVGWLGLSSEVMRHVVMPRVADRAAPIRLVRAFQESGNVAVFAGQPRLLVPHPNLEVVQAVLQDPRLRGRLPPSLQPERPLGPLSRAARWLLRQ